MKSCSRLGGKSGGCRAGYVQESGDLDMSSRTGKQMRSRILALDIIVGASSSRCGVLSVYGREELYYGARLGPLFPSSTLQRRLARLVGFGRELDGGTFGGGDMVGGQGGTSV